VNPLDLYPAASGDNFLCQDTGRPGIPSTVVSGPRPSLDAWAVTFPQPEAGPSYLQEIERQIPIVRGWLFKWIEQGSNEFIHSHLYQTRFPECVQDAYMATSMYMHRNKSNQHTVLRIIESRAKNLVTNHAVDVADSLPIRAEVNSTAVTDSFEHLARVQALLAYQIIGLYDGDIRLRHVCEGHIHVLNTWMQAMANHASQSANLEGSIFSSSGEQTAGPFGATAYKDTSTVKWHSWILTESIRRTWSLVSGVQAGYLMIRQGQAMVPCMGGMLFTSRLGVWEAQSATDWKSITSKGDVGLVEMSQADKLFAQASPDEVNEFTKLSLALTFGYERTKKWESSHR
jgi:hypothetical protein